MDTTKLPVTKLPVIDENKIPDVHYNKKKKEALIKINKISLKIDEKKFEFINNYVNNNDKLIKNFIIEFKNKLNNSIREFKSEALNYNNSSVLKFNSIEFIEKINLYKTLILLFSPLDYQLILIFKIINDTDIKKKIVNYLKNNFFKSIINLISRNSSQYNDIITNYYNVEKISFTIIIIISLKDTSFYLLLSYDNNNNFDKPNYFRKIYNLLNKLDEGKINNHMNKFINDAFCDDINISKILLEEIDTTIYNIVTRSLSNKNKTECDKLKNTRIYVTIDEFYKQIIKKINGNFKDNEILLLNEIDNICLNKPKKDIYKYIKEIITFYLFFNNFDEDTFYSINKDLHIKKTLLLFYDNLIEYTEWLIQQNNKNCYTYIKKINENYDEDKFEDYDDNILPSLSEKNTEKINKTKKGGRKRKQIKTKKHYNKTKE